MTDRDDAHDAELDEWRDLVQSPGWDRLQDAFDHQWSDEMIVRALEDLVVNDKSETVMEEAARLIHVRLAMRLFLDVPRRRIGELERQRASKPGAAPWTRPN